MYIGERASERERTEKCTAGRPYLHAEGERGSQSRVVRVARLGRFSQSIRLNPN